MTAQSLRLLLVEDVENDALLLVRALRKEWLNLDYTRVDTPQALKAALANGPWDAIFSDYHLQGFTGLDSLRIVREMGLDLPFILVSGVLGEEAAVEALQAGANDYLMKGRYARLVPALERALRDVALQRERQQTEAELRQHREHLAGRDVEHLAGGAGAGLRAPGARADHGSRAAPAVPSPRAPSSDRRRDGRGASVLP